MIYLSSKLGEKAASSLLYAGLILLGVCMVIMVIRFKGMGIAAALSLALYAMLLISFFVLVPAMPFNLSNALGAIVSVVIAFAAQVLMLVYVERRFSELHKSRKLALKDGLKASVLPLIGLHVGVFAAAIPCAVFMQGAIVGFALSVIFGAIVSCISLLFTVLLVYVLNPLFANDKAFGLRVSLKEGK
jgi:preprotein translocase subunit SecD